MLYLNDFFIQINDIADKLPLPFVFEVVLPTYNRKKSLQDYTNSESKHCSFNEDGRLCHFKPIRFCHRAA